MQQVTFDRLLVLVMLGVSPALGACLDWDRYDPRLGTSSGGAVGSGSGGAGSSGGAGGGGAGGDAACQSLPTDTFDSPTIDPQWNQQSRLEGAVRITDQQLVVSLPNTMADSGAALLSTALYDITGCGVFVELTQVPDTTTTAVVFLSLQVDKDNAIELVETAGNLQVKWRLGGTETNPRSVVPYSPTEHAYLRISEHGGTVRWEVSPDAKMWMSLWEAQNPLPTTLLRIKLGASTYETVPVIPGAAHFDNFNIVR